MLLSPLQTLQLFENHCRGEPQRMLTNKLAALGEVTPEDARQAIDSLIIRFGSTQRITTELFSKVDCFPVIKGADIGNQLHNLHELCSILQFNMRKCRELSILDLSTGLKPLQIKTTRFPSK